MHTTLRTLVPLAGFALACATTPPPPPAQETQIVVQKQPELIAPPPPSTARFDAKAAAGQAFSAGECTARSKEQYQQSREQGWALLRACVERGKFQRDNYTDLRGVMNGPWVDELPTLNEAPVFFAKLIALRGGDVEGDLKTVQQARVPLFSLQAAMAQPEVYKGRHVVMRGEIAETKAKGDGTSMRLAEQTLQGSVMEGETAGTRKGSTSSSRKDYDAKAEYQTDRYGSGKGSASMRVTGRGDSRETETRVTYDNKLSHTGRSTLAKMVTPDPFLEPGKSYIFLVRFDGMRKTPGAEDEDEKGVPVVSIVGYYAPGPVLVD